MTRCPWPRVICTLNTHHCAVNDIHAQQAWAMYPPPTLYKLRKSPKLIRSLRLLP